jgi:translation initiation factor IF-3
MSRFPSRSWPPREPPVRINGKIRAREVRVVDEEKKPLGVMSLTDALKLAQQQGLDLVEIAPNAVPPVCRIVDFGKFRYEQAKNEKHSQKAGEKLKEIQLSAVIDPHDFDTKVAHAIGFLSEDIKVRLKLRFKGRQKAHKEFGFEVVNRFVQALAAFGQSDSPPKLMGDRDLNVLLTPLPREKRAKLAAE